jgi:hypothetical protein
MSEAAPTRARDGLRPRSRVRAEAGSATLEQIGMAALVSGIMAALFALPLAPQVAENLRVALCRITGGDCAPARPIPRCVVASRDRTIGASVTISSIKVAHDDKVSVIKYGDGTARVTTADLYGLGAEAGAGVKFDLDKLAGRFPASVKETLYGEISAGGLAGAQFGYDFDSHEAADRWVEQNRGALAQLTNFAGGVLADGLEQGVNWAARQLGFGGDGVLAPTVLMLDIGSEVKGGGGFGVSTLAGASAQGSGKGTGSLELNLADGTRKFTGALEATGGVQGDLAFMTNRAGLTGKVAYAVSYDAQGNPVELTLTGEAARSWDLGSLKKGLPVSPTGKINYGGSVQVAGDKALRSYTLDLRNPANRAAFERAFVTTGPIAVPRVEFLPTPGLPAVDVPVTVANFAPLADRLASDAVYVEADYDTDEFGGTGGIKAGAGFWFGADGTYKAGSTTLRGARSQDFGVPSSALGPLTSCGR